MYSQLVLVAHRGWPIKYKENTVRSFQLAIERASSLERGRVFIECDVYRSWDNKYPIIHDPTFKKDGKKFKVVNSTLTNLKKYDPEITTLDEVLGLHFPTIVEIKDPRNKTVKEVYQMLKGKEDDVVISSFWPGVSKLGKNLNERIKTTVIYHSLPLPPKEKHFGEEAFRVGAEGVAVRFDTLTPEQIDIAHKNYNLKVGAWVVDYPEKMIELANMNVDLLVTNDIGLAIETLYQT